MFGSFCTRRARRSTRARVKPLDREPVPMEPPKRSAPASVTSSALEQLHGPPSSRDIVCRRSKNRLLQCPDIRRRPPPTIGALTICAKSVASLKRLFNCIDHFSLAYPAHYFFHTNSRTRSRQQPWRRATPTILPLVKFDYVPGCPRSGARIPGWMGNTPARSQLPNLVS